MKTAKPLKSLNDFALSLYGNIKQRLNLNPVLVSNTSSSLLIDGISSAAGPSYPVCLNVWVKSSITKFM
jgi:hypothetical protein